MPASCSFKAGTRKLFEKHLQHWIEISLWFHQTYKFRNFSDFVVYAVTTLIFPKNQRQCASFSINVATLFLSSKRATTVPNKLIDKSALETAVKENTDRTPFTLTFHPHNHAVESIIFINFKLLQNYSEIGTIFSQLPLISLKRDKNISNFLVRSSFQTNDQSGTFKCARSRCKTCPFIYNVEKLSVPKRSIRITDHFTCTSANVI